MTTRYRYVIVTPARDEEKNIMLTIQSVVNQTEPPAEWIIVDDGSQDGTPGIIDECCRKYPWMHAVHLNDRGARLPGAGVMEAFLRGVDQLRVKDWEYIVKLDADLSFAPDYFSTCLARFRENPRLGIGGGTVLNQIGETLINDDSGAPHFHVRGATKIYRKACWDDIGGPMKVTGWDTLDEIKANMRGWTTQSFPDIQLFQQRTTGAVQGVWRNALKNGRGSYIAGYHPLFMACKCIKRMVPPAPRPVEAAGLAWGFLTSYINPTRRAPDPTLLRYLRDQQLRKITGRETMWR